MVERGLTPLFAPRSIAFVGASSDPRRIGGRPLSYCLRDGFKGGLYPVNPARAEVQGLRAYPTLDAVPGPVDMAVIAIDAAGVPEAVAQAGRKGAGAAVILSSGFAEVGEHGLQQEVLDAAAPSGLRVLGPNSLGVFSNGEGVCATFSSLLERGPVKAGPVAVVSQSGAYGAHVAMLLGRRGVGISRFVTTGNEADITVADCVAYMAADPAVRVIGCYSEGVGDGRALLRAAEAARAAGKPVVMLKVGRSEDGRKAAASHTASLAGDDAVFDALVRGAGVQRVESTQAFVDLLYALSRRPPVAGDRLGVMTVSGGAGVLMADAAAQHDFTLPPMPEAAQAALKARIPFCSAVNPVDTTAQAMNDLTLVRDALAAMLGSGRYDAVAGFFMNWPDSPMLGPGLREAIAAATTGRGDRTVALAMNAGADTVAAFDAAGLLVFEDPSHMVATLAASRRAGEALAGGGSGAPEPPAAEPLDASRLDEAQASSLLAAAKVPMAPVVTGGTPEEIAEHAAAWGRPVVLKILSPDILHKSDVGGVRLGLEGADAIRTAAAEMRDACRRASPGAELRGFLASPLAQDGVELLVGGRVDPSFGPIVTVGLGGVFAEIFRDVAIGPAPLTIEHADRLLRSLRAWPLLAGARGGAPADAAAAARAVAAIAAFTARHRESVGSVEINPLRVGPQGAGALGLDAVITPAATKVTQAQQ